MMPAHALDPIRLDDLTPEARAAERRLREIETPDPKMDSGGLFKPLPNLLTTIGGAARRHAAGDGVVNENDGASLRRGCLVQVGEEIGSRQRKDGRRK